MSVSILFGSTAQAFAPKILDMRTPAYAKKFAKSQLPYWGWNRVQWSCLNTLWTRESNWRPNAKNSTPVKMWINGKVVKLYAGGIPQRIGLNPKTSVQRQVNVGLSYIRARYGSPCVALNHSFRVGWY